MSYIGSRTWDQLKIQTYFNECTKRYEHYYTTIAELEKMLQKFVHDETYTGEQADSARAFINEFLIPTLNQMARAIRMLQTKQQEMLSKFNEEVDSSSVTIVDDHHLNQVIKDFSAFLTSFQDISGEIKKEAEQLNSTCTLEGMFNYTVPNFTQSINAFKRMTDENGRTGLLPKHKKEFDTFDEAHSTDVNDASEFGQLINMIRTNLRRVRDTALSDDVSAVILDYNHCTELKKQIIHPEDVLTEEQLKEFEKYVEQLNKYLRGEGTRCSVFGSDPVNMTEGNYVGHWEDICLRGLPSIPFVRFYNGKSDYCSVLGKGWSHYYDRKLTISDFGRGQVITVQRHDSSELLYFINDDGEISQEAHGENYKIKKSGTGWTLSGEDVVKEKYGSDGWLKELIINAGKIKVIRDPEHPERVLKVNNIVGSSLSFIYDREGYLTSVTDHTGREVKYKYRKLNDVKVLSEIEELSGSVRHIEYDSEGRVAVLSRDNEPARVKNSYDPNGRIREQSYADGGKVTFEYDDEKGETIYIEQNGNVIRYLRDEKRRHIATVYADGTEYFKYDDRNNKIAWTDKLGNTTRYTYDSKGHLTSVINAEGAKASMTYDKDGHLFALKRADGAEWRFIHDKNGRILKTQDPEGNTTSYVYDPLGQCTEVRQADGTKYSAKYRNGNIVEFTDTDGQVQHYEYDSLNRVISVRDADGNQKKYEYDNTDHVIAVTDELGNTTRYIWNKAGKLQSVINPDGTEKCIEYNDIGKVCSVTDENGNSTEYEYDIMMREAARILPNGGKVHFDYDALGNCVGFTDAMGRKTDFSYDPMGRLKAVIQENVQKKSYEYDVIGRKISETDAEGHKTQMEYDAAGRLISITDCMGAVTRFEYDGLDRIISKTDALGNRTEWTYDAMGRPLRVTDAVGGTIERKYDVRGNITEILLNGREHEKREYDSLGRLIKKIYVDGSFTTYQYDPCSNLIEMKKSTGRYEHFSYDCMGRVIEKSDCGRVTNYEYTPIGMIRRVVDPLGNSVEYEYNELGQTTKVTRYGKNKAEKTDKGETAVTERGHVTICEYDLGGKLIAETDALGNKNLYAYDELGRLKSKTDKDGSTSKYSYNSLDQLTDVRYEDGRHIHYKMDARGHIREIEDWLGVTQITTDALDRVTDITDYKGRSISYEYNGVGDKTALIYPDGHRVEYNYDSLRRLQSLIDRDNITSYSYDDVGRLAKKSLPNGNLTEYDYYCGGQLKSMVSKDADGILDKYEYLYNETGERIRAKRYRRGMEAVSGTYDYDYDKLGHLTRITKDNAFYKEYHYDGYGNRIKMIEPDVEIRYEYDVLDRLCAEKRFTVAGVPELIMEKCFNYDKRGNMTDVLENGEMTGRYSYDSSNRMISASDGINKTVKYAYNALGFRVESDIYFDEQENILRPDRHIEYICDLTRDAYNLLGRIVDGKEEAYTWDTNVVSMKTAKADFYYMQDELGSPMYLTGTDGAAVASYAFDDFGNELDPMTGAKLSQEEISDRHGYTRNGNILQPFAFTGYQKDEVNDLLHAQARYYSASTGRFTATDQIWGQIDVPDSQNHYAYCGNSPIFYIDIDGKEKLIVSGGNDDSEGGFRYQFIETALKSVNDELAAGTPADEITWVVVNAGFNDDDISHFKSTAAKYGINLKIVDTKAEFINYINNKDGKDRSKDMITDVKFFCHGQTSRYSNNWIYNKVSGLFGLHPGVIENQLSFSLDIKDLGNRKHSDIDFTQSDISLLDSAAFKNATTTFYSCNAGTEDSNGKSFAQLWSNKTGGLTYGIKNGRSYYGAINSSSTWGFYTGLLGSIQFIPIDYWNWLLDKVGLASDSWKEKKVKKAEREKTDSAHKKYNYAESGSMNYPCVVSLDGDLDTLIDGAAFSRGWKVYSPEGCD